MPPTQQTALPTRAITAVITFLLLIIASVMPASPAGALGKLAIAVNPTGLGYWTVDGAGAVTPKEGAPFFGGMKGKHLNEPIVGMAATATGDGYWLVASDGGIFSFGAAA